MRNILQVMNLRVSFYELATSLKYLGIGIQIDYKARKKLTSCPSADEHATFFFFVSYQTLNDCSFGELVPRDQSLKSDLS